MDMEIAGMYFVLGILLLSILLVLVLGWLGYKVWRTKTVGGAEVSREQDYRKLSEDAIAVQQLMIEEQKSMVEEQKRMNDHLEDLGKRIAAIEKMLREVE